MNPRVFLARQQLEVGEVITVTGDDGHHLARVLRVKQNEVIALGAGGRGYLASVDAVDPQQGSVAVTVTEALSSHEPQIPVYLIQGLPKAEKTESIVQHGTELGIAGFLLFQSARSVVRLDAKDAKKQQGRLERWNRVAREAAGQSQRDVIPTLGYAAKWNELEKFIADLAPLLVLLLDEDEDVKSLSDVLPGNPLSQVHHGPVILCVGPEGGWDDSERQQFRDLGALPVTLGPRVLRTETAGLVGAAAVLYHFHALGG